MGFRIRTDDITKMKCDVIVNSLGINTERYGGICRSIVNTVEGKEKEELKEIIKSKNGHIGIGDMFLTSGYNLPAKKILHVVTPFAKYDQDMSIYEEVLRNILVKCYQDSLFKICIPKIGTAANGYDESQALFILMKMCSDFCNLYSKADITIVLYNHGQNDLFLKNGDDAELISRLPDLDEKFNERDMYDQNDVFVRIHKDIIHFEQSMLFYKHNHPDLIREERDYDSKFFSCDGPLVPKKWIKKDMVKRVDDIIVDLTKEKEIIDLYSYMEKYINLRIPNKGTTRAKVKDKVRIYIGRGDKVKGTKIKYKLTAKEQHENKRLIYLAAFAVEMNYRELNDCLEYYGLTFIQNANYGDAVFDKCIKYCFENEIYDINEINNRLGKFGCSTLFA